jgi:hypothetical protein
VFTSIDPSPLSPDYSPATDTGLSPVRLDFSNLPGL